MTLLGLWDVSILLTFVSLLIMVALILTRLFAEHRARGMAARRATVLPRLLSGDIEGSGVLKTGKADGLTADLMVELVQMVRGDEREQFVSLASRLGVTDILVGRLRKGSPRTKVTAAEALAHFPDAHVTNALDAALEDRSKDVRLAAALSLADSGRAPPVSVLADRLQLGSTENSLLITTMLQRMVDEHSEEIEALLDDPLAPAPLKAAAIDALSSFGKFDVAPAVNRLALATDPASEELARYLRALGTFQHPAGIPAVKKHLNARTWWVRAAAAEAAGRIGIADTLPQLSKLLEDPDWWVRFRAGEALSRLGPDGLATLKRAATSFSEPARSAARLTLAEHGLAFDA